MPNGLTGYYEAAYWSRNAMYRIRRYCATLILVSASVGSVLCLNRYGIAGEQTKSANVTTNAARVASDLDVMQLTGSEFRAPKLANGTRPLNVTSQVPCPDRVACDVLVDESGAPFGVKIEKMGERYAKCEDAVVEYMLRRRFEPGRRGAVAITSWTTIPIQIEATKNPDLVAVEAEMKRTKTAVQ